jgi:uncharacterized protein YxjI
VPRAPDLGAAARMQDEEVALFRRQREAAASPGVYQMRQQMFSIGDDFWIESGGQRVFRVDGKALRIRKSLVLESADGRELYRIQEKLAHIRDTMDIDGPGGRVATVKKALISPLREHYSVDLAAGGQWTVKGNIVDHEYEITSQGGRIAEIGKRWFRVRDTYGISVSPGQDDALVIAVAIVVDQISHPAR